MAESVGGDPLVRCDVCGRVEDRDRAIEAGWCPCFWATEAIRRDEPVCPECAREHREGLDEQPILKPGHLIALGGGAAPSRPP